MRGLAGGGGRTNRRGSQGAAARTPHHSGAPLPPESVLTRRQSQKSEPSNLAIAVASRQNPGDLTYQELRGPTGSRYLNMDMALVRPRLTEFHGIDVAQTNVDFAIPFLEEDLPLYVDPFLLWKSPSLQDQSLHGAMIAAFNRLGMLPASRSNRRGCSNHSTDVRMRRGGIGRRRDEKGKRVGPPSPKKF